MPRTPDRVPGTSDEEATLYEPTALSTIEGEVRYDGTRFSLKDASGEFDPRVAVGDVLLPRVLTSDVTVAGDKTALAHNTLIQDGVDVLVLDGGEMLAI